MFRSKKNKARKNPPAKKKKPSAEDLIERYQSGGSVPWSKGYREYKLKLIADSIRDEALLDQFRVGKIPAGYGKGVDERCVEYPWVISHLLGETGKTLDAGSALNFEEIVTLPFWEKVDLTIAGLAVEKRCYYSRGISYQFCDLRDLPYRDNWFDSIACVSTLEHIGMDNSIYGHDDEVSSEAKSAPRPDPAGFQQAVSELVRVAKPEAKLLITVPVGRFEYHGFFQQFDEELLSLLKAEMSKHGTVSEQYFQYSPEGWAGCDWSDCQDSTSHNPHTGEGKGDDGAAHCRAVGCFLAEK